MVEAPIFVLPGEAHALIASGEVIFVHDAIERQLHELVAKRAPDRELSREERAERVAAHLGAMALEDYGAWVHYPWARRLVHVLPEAEFRELRLSANRNRISEGEQRALGALSLGVVGLSTGQSVLMTLAMEGIGGRFKIADFDALELSNLNRVRSGVHAIGLNKAACAARELYEFDPYAEIVVFPEGLTDASLEPFLEGLDLVFEECDDLALKVRLRERARARRIPVIMATSDRGLLDVERFDREPGRPVLHGLLRGRDAAELSSASKADKLGVVFDVLGRAMSPDLAASFVDVGATLKTWPQLASEVVLGGAVAVHAARRLALGTLQRSGRFTVDLEHLLSDDTAAEPLGAGDACGEGEARGDAIDPATRDAEPRPAGAPARAPTGTAEWARAFVAAGTTAPSGGNAQPWRLVVRRGILLGFRDEQRARSRMDPDGHAALLALGAFARNVELAAGELGMEARIVPFPEGTSGPVFAVDATRAARAARDPMAAWIGRRVTHRGVAAQRVPLRVEDRARLEAAAARAGAELTWLESDEALAELGAVLADNDRLRMLCPALHRELMGELRWSAREATQRRDGLALDTLGLPPAALVTLRLLADERVVRRLHRIDGGRALGEGARQAIVRSSAVGLLSVEGRDAGAYLRGGRAVQDVWLTATGLDLGLHPMTPLHLFAAPERLTPLFSEDEARLLADQHRRFDALFGPARGARLLVFRLFHAPAPSARSLRLPVDDVLTFE